MTRSATVSLTEFLRQRGLWCFITLAWMAVIFYLSSVPYSGELTELFLGDLNTLGRKIAHLTEYAILAVLCRKAGGPSRRSFVMAALIALTFAVTDEWHQVFVPGRGANPLDVMVDAAGIFLALWLMSFWKVRPPA
ncbi:MAG: VanZ family protein [Gemmatimonadaceae bacterium]|nr:VanZ family protein [Gloeobacterales cyanobacterium ES-bin-141]